MQSTQSCSCSHRKPPLNSTLGSVPGILLPWLLLTDLLAPRQTTWQRDKVRTAHTKRLSITDHTQNWGSDPKKIHLLRSRGNMISLNLRPGGRRRGSRGRQAVRRSPADTRVSRCSGCLKQETMQCFQVTCERARGLSVISRSLVTPKQWDAVDTIALSHSPGNGDRGPWWAQRQCFALFLQCDTLPRVSCGFAFSSLRLLTFTHMCDISHLRCVSYQTLVPFQEYVCY